MKRILIILFILPILISAQNVSVKDYNVPVSRATNLRINGFWNWSQIGDSVSGNSSTTNLVFRKFYSSLPFAWFLDVDATGGRTGGRNNYDVRFEGNVRKYVWPNEDWFGFSRLAAQKATQYRRLESNLTLGGGYGRYINATALAKAVRIEEHLIRENVISNYMPKASMIDIANIIEREDEYQDLYGEVYETQWLGDIEKAIVNSGMLVGQRVGAIGILRIRQVLFEINERINQRYYGWDISAGALFTLTTRDASPAGSPNLSLTGRYSFPISWRTQINFTAGAFTPIDSAFSKRITGNTSVDFIFELSNRINLLASHRLVVFKNSGQNTVVDNILSASFLFYMENNIYFGINTAFEKFYNSPKRISANLTLSYNLF